VKNFVETNPGHLGGDIMPALDEMPALHELCVDLDLVLPRALPFDLSFTK
jgi:hypothetical protein